MDAWFFDENLGHQEILERSEKEFGIKASQQTLTRYFRRREQLLNVPDGVREIEPAEEEAEATRVGAGMGWEDLQARTLRFATMAAYEMSLVEPEKMRVKDIRSLMKMVNEQKRLTLEHRLQKERLALQTMALTLRVKIAESKVQTKEQMEQMIMDAAEIWNKAKRKCAEGRTELEKLKREAEVQPSEPMEADPMAGRMANGAGEQGNPATKEEAPMVEADGGAKDSQFYNDI